MTIARTVFCLSVVATLFWAFGFARGAHHQVPNLPLWPYAASAIVVTGLSVLALFRAWPHFLAGHSGTAGRFVRGVAVWMLVAYVVGAVVVGGLAFWLFNPSAQATEALRSEASLAAYMLALWFPPLVFACSLVCG